MSHRRWYSSLSPKYRLARLFLELLEDRSLLAAGLAQSLLGPSTLEVREDDPIVSIAVVPNDPQFNQLYGLHNTGQSGGTVDADIDAVEAWDITTGTMNSVVAVIDTGIDYRHPDLYLNIWINQGEIPANLGVVDADGDGIITFHDLNHPSNAGKVNELPNDGNSYIDAGDLLADSRWVNGIDGDGNGYRDDLVGWNFVNNTNNPFDDNGHGTHVAGTIGALGNNGIGVVGVNWAVQLVPVKFLDASGSGYLSAAVSALNYTLGKGIKISNNSWGGGGYYSPMANALVTAQSAGHIFVAAAGNAGTNIDFSPSYPASYNFDNVVAVASTNRYDQLSWFSNYGANTVDIAAPGEAIRSTTPNNTYSTYDGTSMATPHVSGAIALLWGYQPTLTYSEVIARLKDPTNVDPGSGLTGRVQSGRLNAFKVLDDTPPVPDTTPPSVLSAVALGTSTTLTGWRVTFSEAMNTSSFTAADLVSFTGPSGAIPLSGVSIAWVQGSNTQVDITFAAQYTNGTYTLTFGPNITDLAGNALTLPYTATHNLFGDTTPPTVLSAVALGTSTTLTGWRVTFSEAMNTSSFTAADLVSFTGPSGAIPLSGVSITWVQGSNTQVNLTFAAQTTPGTYSLTFGPGITDLAGNPMAQAYTASFTVVGDITPPTVSSVAVLGNTLSFTGWRVTFSEAMNTGSFTAADLGAFVVPSGVTPPSVNITWVQGSNTQVDLTFAAQTTPGTYSLTFGPGITDLAGNPMAQAYTASFTVVGDTTPPAVSSVAVLGNTLSFTGWRVTFSEAMNTSSFTAADLGAFVVPSGVTPPSVNIAWVQGSNTQVDLTFAAQTTPGTYSLTFGPGITDLAGNPMAQAYTASFTVVGDITPPTVSSVVPLGTATSLTGWRVTFSEAMNTGSFTAADLGAFVVPSGVTPPSVNIAWVQGSNTQVDLTFAAQTTPGTYRLTFGPGITDLAGNPMAQAYTASFTVQAPSTTYEFTNSTRRQLWDGWVTTSTISVNQDLVIRDLNVRLNITHTYVSDLWIWLRGPNGYELTLAVEVGGSGDNFINTVFDDEASQSIRWGYAPFTGSYRPSGAPYEGDVPLSIYDGFNARGTWRLYIWDMWAGDSGWLNSWSLIVTTGASGRGLSLPGETGNGPESAGGFSILSAKSALPTVAMESAPLDLDSPVPTGAPADSLATLAWWLVESGETPSSEWSQGGSSREVDRLLSLTSSTGELALPMRESSLAEMLFSADEKEEDSQSVSALTEEESASREWEI